MAFVSVQQCLMSSLMFLFVWTMEIGSAASLSSLESDLPNSSRFFLSGVTRRRCPSLAVGSSVSINEHGTGLLQAVRHDRHASCHYPVQCDVSASPPEVQISWYQLDENDNEILIDTKTQKDITIDYLTEESFPESQQKLFGMSQTLNRICLDSHMGGSHQTYRFKCRVESACTSEKKDSKVISVRPQGYSLNANRVASHRRAPMITTVTSTRLEFNGPLVQLFCHATGTPKPQITWALMDELNENKLYSIAEQSYIKVLETNDIIVDTRDVSATTLTFVCNATNGMGHDAETSTLILPFPNAQ